MKYFTKKKNEEIFTYKSFDDLVGWLVGWLDTIYRLVLLFQMQANMEIHV